MMRNRSSKKLASGWKNAGRNKSRGRGSDTGAEACQKVCLDTYVAV